MSTPRKSQATSFPLMLDDALCFALYSTSLTMSKVYKPHLEALGLTYPQYVVMLALWAGDGLSVSELGEQLCLDSGTLTPLLKRLEANGLLERVRDTQDERVVRIFLTSGGRQLARKASDIPEFIRCATRCSQPELRHLNRTLLELRESLVQSLEGA